MIGGLLRGGAMDGVKDFDEAGAAAEIAGETFADFFVGGVGIGFEKMGCGDKHAGCADSALGSAALQKSFLERVQFSVDSEAFDGLNAGSVGLQDGHEAAVDKLAVHAHAAGAAFAFAAAFLGAGEVKIFAEDVEETLHGRDVEGLRCVVDGEDDLAHIGSANEGIPQGLKAEFILRLLWHG
jgi:hypothetical protein